MTTQYNIIIGIDAAKDMIHGNHCLIIGDGQLKDAVTIPDNTVSIQGIYEGVIDDPRWATAMQIYGIPGKPFSYHELLLFIRAQCTAFDIDADATVELASRLIARFAKGVT
mgnify:CR=1 FL=1